MWARVAAVARKEAMHIRRDPRLIMSIFMMPLLQLVLFSYALSFDVRDLSTAVLDRDNTALSRSFARAFEKSGYFHISNYLTEPAQVEEALSRGSAKVVITVPRGFAKSLYGRRTAEAQVLIDGSEPNAAVLARAYASAVASTFSAKKQLAAIQIDPKSPTGRPTALEPRVRVWYNPDLRGIVFFLPGLIVVIMANLTTIQTALALVREKDFGTMEQLLVSPLRPWELMVGKILPFAAIVTFDTAIITLVGIYGFGVPFRGGAALFALAAILFAFASLGLGLVISAIASTMEAANQLGFFVSMLPAFILSGFIWPIENMPRALQYISLLFPGRYFLAVTRTLFLKGAGLSVVLPNLAALAFFSVATLALAAISFRERLG